MESNGGTAITQFLSGMAAVTIQFAAQTYCRTSDTLQTDVAAYRYLLAGACNNFQMM